MSWLLKIICSNAGHHAEGDIHALEARLCDRLDCRLWQWFHRCLFDIGNLWRKHILELSWILSCNIKNSHWEKVGALIMSSPTIQSWRIWCLEKWMYFLHVSAHNMVSFVYCLGFKKVKHHLLLLSGIQQKADTCTADFIEHRRLYRN